MIVTPIPITESCNFTPESLFMPSSDTPTLSDIDQLTIDTIRTLSMDAVEAAKSGHPGTPMALAPVAYTVWERFPTIRSPRSKLAES